MRCWRCFTIRACRCSNTPASAMRSTSRWGCRSCAPRSITAPRLIWPAAARRTPAACWRRSNWPHSMAACAREHRTPAPSPHRPANDSASISCMIPRSSPASSLRSRCSQAMPWSKSDPDSGALTARLLDSGRPAGRDRNRSRPGGHAARAMRSAARLHAARGRRARRWTGVPSPASAARHCAWSAICPTTSRRRCCSACCETPPTSIRDMHFMLQKEVVDRIVAAPGSDAYGRLTVMLAPHGPPSACCDVGAGAFRPVPKVDFQRGAADSISRHRPSGRDRRCTARWSRRHSISDAKRCAMHCVAISVPSRSSSRHRSRGSRGNTVAAAIRRAGAGSRRCVSLGHAACPTIVAFSPPST